MPKELLFLFKVRLFGDRGKVPCSGKAPHYKKKKRKRKRKREVRDLSSWSPKGLALGITNRQRVPTIESKQRGTEPLSPVDERKKGRK